VPLAQAGHQCRVPDPELPTEGQARQHERYGQNGS
jgi:hypothetical protein